MRNQFAVCYQTWLMFCKVLNHLIERRYECKLKLSICVFSVCNKWNTVVLKFSRVLFKIYLLLILNWKETKNPQYAMQTLPTQFAPLVKSSCAPKSTTFCHLCFKCSFLVIGEYISTHGNDSTSQCDYLLCGIIYNCPSYTVSA